MSVLLKHVTNSLWHAFNSLYQETPGYVNKSKLKVLTANIATLFDLYGVEKGLDHYRSTTALNFKHFKFYLSQEVFASLSNNNKLKLTEIRSLIQKIDEICWLISRKSFTNIITNYSDDNIYKLFRIYCLLADFNDSNEDNTEVLLHSSEAYLIIKQLVMSIGQEYDYEKFYEHLKNSNENYTFGEFLNLVKFKKLNNLEFGEPLNEAVNEMYLTYIEDVLKKGFLYRKGYLLPTLREYWIVLQPCELSYYKNSSESVLCGTIPIDSNSVVKPCPTQSGKPEKFQKFILSTGDQNYELATLDHRTRMQWIASFQLAITYSAGKEGFQRDLCSRRRTQRELENNKKQAEDTLKRNHFREAQSFKKQFEKEKLARLAAENQARQLEVVAREDSRRVAELEDVKLTLERLLKDEQLAKRDEEIVRALQARVLAEEWEKREELEKLQVEQTLYLEQERKKREEFEKRQIEKEHELKLAESKLKKLEGERHKLDLELKQARTKILHSEMTKEMLEDQLSAFDPQIREGERDGVRRAISLTTKQRPLINIAARSSTLKKSKV